MSAVIEQITPHHPNARALLRAAEEELAALYPPSSQHPLGPNAIEEGVMMVAWLDGDAVACGVVRPLLPRIGEIKRMFVKEVFRRRGLARKILSELEALALKLDFNTLRLETGERQPEAIALYRQSGYRRIPPYGDYVDDPLSVCFEKRLDGAIDDPTSC